MVHPWAILLVLALREMKELFLTIIIVIVRIDLQCLILSFDRF